MSAAPELPRWCQRPRLAIALPLSVVVLAATGGLLATCALEPFFFSARLLTRLGLEHWCLTVGLGLSTTLLLAAALRVGAAHEDPLGGRPLMTYAALGMLNAPAAFGAAYALHGVCPDSRILSASVVGAFGIPLGLIFGAVYSPLSRRLRRVVIRPTLSDHGNLLQVTGLVAATGGLLSTAVVVLTRNHTIVPLLLPVGLVDLGLLSMALGWALKARLRTLAEHCDRVPLSELGIDPDGLLPLAPESRGEAALVLPLPEIGAGSYRSAEVRVPVGLVD
ncbi:MAG: hypothetical protein JJ863_13575 [Deltaproteobacteria bacterium]|nr:hypothetical protein [Deltaproteobacteria bacterium]